MPPKQSAVVMWLLPLKLLCNQQQWDTQEADQSDRKRGGGGWMWNMYTNMPTCWMYTALGQPGGISLLLIIIRKPLHLEHLSFHAHHDSRSLPATSHHAHQRTQPFLFFLSSFHSVPRLAFLLTIFTSPQGLPAGVSLSVSPQLSFTSWVS